ncbi:hypothetical protein PR202_ga26090 [Eleusine coracana subsp. coracana]|uniref:Uncharacterized protein n=1 Tax=Eleusine coracana subsp. coracana TaxID=191504 RepID=A0AAV5DD18_ELECO|nr:hypothetical protein PR202_ga26090 [Eleusine coracana subsp. coracana]
MLQEQPIPSASTSRPPADEPSAGETPPLGHPRRSPAPEETDTPAAPPPSTPAAPSPSVPGPRAVHHVLRVFPVLLLPGNARHPVTTDRYAVSSVGHAVAALVRGTLPVHAVLVWGPLAVGHSASRLAGARGRWRRRSCRRRWRVGGRRRGGWRRRRWSGGGRRRSSSRMAAVSLELACRLIQRVAGKGGVGDGGRRERAGGWRREARASGARGAVARSPLHPPNLHLPCAAHLSGRVTPRATAAAAPAVMGVPARRRLARQRQQGAGHVLGVPEPIRHPRAGLRSSRPSVPVLLVLAVLPVASASSLLALSSREQQLAKVAGRAGVSAVAAIFIFRLVEAALGLVALFTLPAFFRALMLYSGKKTLAKDDKVVLSERQRGLLGLKTPGLKGAGMGEQINRPPKAKPSTPSEPIVPIRKSSFSYTTSVLRAIKDWLYLFEPCW